MDEDRVDLGFSEPKMKGPPPARAGESTGPETTRTPPVTSRLRERLRRPGQDPPSESPVDSEHVRAELVDKESSSRGSTDELAQAVAVVLTILAQGANWYMRRRGSASDWRMRKGEARAIARPLVKIASRRMQIRGVSGDALDAGSGLESASSYFFRVVQGEAADEAAAPPVSPGVDPAALRRRQQAERVERAEAEAAAARDAAARARAPRNEELGNAQETPEADYFSGFEDV